MAVFSGFYESHEQIHRAMQRVVARWRRPVASGKALVMLHRAMRSVSHRRTALTIEMARDGGTFVRRRRLFRLL
jgi:hypothetical protein